MNADGQRQQKHQDKPRPASQRGNRAGALFQGVDTPNSSIRRINHRT